MSRQTQQDQSQGLFYYFNDVLGVREFSAALEPVINTTKKIGIYLADEPSAKARELILKMLSAISLTDRDVHWYLDGQTQDPNAAIFYIYFSEKAPGIENVKAYRLPSLEALLGVGVSAEETNAAKKTAWQELKVIRKELDVWLS